MAATTVLVVDDHAGFRTCARRMLEREGYRVVGEAGDGESAVDRARELHPELALVDVYLPDIDGFEVATRLAQLDGAPAVIVVVLARLDYDLSLALFAHRPSAGLAGRPAGPVPSGARLASRPDARRRPRARCDRARARQARRPQHRGRGAGAAAAQPARPRPQSARPWAAPGS